MPNIVGPKNVKNNNNRVSRLLFTCSVVNDGQRILFLSGLFTLEVVVQGTQSFHISLNL
jgi:hypothetical protein